MQLFGLGGKPEHAASKLCDTHVQSQVRETLQMCTTALRFVHGCNITGKIDCTEWRQGMREPYANFSQHHPIVWWVAGARTHFRWALAHGLALAHEYEHRNGKKHMCEAFLLHLQRWVTTHGLPESMPETASPEAWLDFVLESKREEWAERIARDLPPDNCEFGVIALKDFDSSTPGSWVDSYREYYQLKRVEWAEREVRPIVMKWSGPGEAAAKKRKRDSHESVEGA